MFSASYVASLLATLYCSVGQFRVSRFRGNDSSCMDGGACTRDLKYHERMDTCLGVCEVMYILCTSYTLCTHFVHSRGDLFMIPVPGPIFLAVVNMSAGA
jgi:hypothetical protein